MCDPCWNNQHEKCAGGACKCKNPKHGRAKDVEPVGDEELGSLDKAFLRYRNMDKAQLAAIYKQSHKVSDLRGVSAKVLVYDIMRDDFGNRKVDEWLKTGAKDAQPDLREVERWKQHMHQDGLWCGDVNCKTCAKSGAMAKGVKEMKRAKDAEVKCAGCGTSSKTLYEDAKAGSHGGQFWCAGCGGRPVKGGKIVKATDDVKPVKYNTEAVQKEINKDKRIGGKEAKAIHALLKGRTGDEAYTFKQEGKLIRRSDGLLSDDPILGIKRHPELWPPKAGQAKDVSPFDVDTDAGAERIVRREARAGLTATQIARKHGFSLSFVKEVLLDVKPV